MSQVHLAHHRVTLDDGHEVSVSLAGDGVPLVIAHGYLAEGLLYAATLSRLVAQGFMVVAVDSAGHGGTDILPIGGRELRAHADLLGRTLDHLGIRHAVLVGHSMGGRLVAELAADQPERVLGLVLVDAVVGATWDRIVMATRFWPPLAGAVGGLLLADLAATFPIVRDRRQAKAMARELVPTVVAHFRNPWRLASSGLSFWQSDGSGRALKQIRDAALPVAVLHGDRDLGVPARTSHDTARRVDGDLVIVHGGRHSWLLKDVDAMPAIMAELLDGRFGDGIEQRRQSLPGECLAPEALARRAHHPAHSRGPTVPPNPSALSLDDLAPGRPSERWERWERRLRRERRRHRPGRRARARARYRPPYPWRADGGLSEAGASPALPLAGQKLPLDSLSYRYRARPVGRPRPGPAERGVCRW